MKMKRIIFLAVSIIFSICSLVGCGENKSDTYPEVTSEPVAASTTYSEQEQYYLDNYYRAKHILIMTENRTSLEAKDLCDDLYEQAQNGKDFDLLIREYSEDPGCAKNPNGYFFTDGQMVIEFENAVKSIDAGEFTTCKSDYGYHVVQRLSLDETPEIFEEGYKNSVANNDNITENDKHFDITRTEFINKYNELFDELNYDPYDTYSPFADYPTRTYEPTEDVLLSNPNTYKIYEYNTSYVSPEWVSYLPDSYVRIFVDKDDNVIGVTISTFNDYNLRTNQVWKEFVYDECTATYMAITGESNAGTARKALNEAESSPETGEKGSYVYGIVENKNYDNRDTDKTFTIKVINQ